MSNSKYTVIEIGEDSDMWLVVSQIDVSKEEMSRSEARLAVIEHLMDVLLPGEFEVFADCVESLVGYTSRSYEYPIYGSEEGVCYRSPVGSTRIPSKWERQGTCGVTFGFSLPSHLDVLDAVNPTGVK